MKFTFRRFLVVTTVGMLALGSVMGSNVQARQGHMDNALASLRAARQQLEVARHDKDGHREAAIRIVDNAIAEVKAGIDAGE